MTASTAAQSPKAQSSATLPGACGQMLGASSASASMTSVTAGRTWYSTATASAASRGGKRFGNHHCDRLADKAHAIVSKRQVQQVEDLALRRGLEARHRHVVGVGRIGKMRHTDMAVGEIILSDERGDHAWTAARRRRVDRHDTGMRVRSAHEYGIGLTRQRDVVGVIAAPAHKAQIFEPRQSAPDEGTGVSRSFSQHCTIALLQQSICSAIEPIQACMPLPIGRERPVVVG